MNKVKNNRFKKHTRTHHLKTKSKKNTYMKKTKKKYLGGMEGAGGDGGGMEGDGGGMEEEMSDDEGEASPRLDARADARADALRAEHGLSSAGLGSAAGVGSSAGVGAAAGDWDIENAGLLTQPDYAPSFVKFKESTQKKTSRRPQLTRHNSNVGMAAAAFLVGDVFKSRHPLAITLATPTWNGVVTSQEIIDNTMPKLIHSLDIPKIQRFEEWLRQVKTRNTVGLHCLAILHVPHVDDVLDAVWPGTEMMICINGAKEAGDSKPDGNRKQIEVIRGAEGRANVNCHVFNQSIQDAQTKYKQYCTSKGMVAIIGETIPQGNSVGNLNAGNQTNNDGFKPFEKAGFNLADALCEINLKALDDPKHKHYYVASISSVIVSVQNPRPDLAGRVRVSCGNAMRAGVVQINKLTGKLTYLTPNQAYRLRARFGAVSGTPMESRGRRFTSSLLELREPIYSSTIKEDVKATIDGDDNGGVLLPADQMDRSKEILDSSKLSFDLLLTKEGIDDYNEWASIREELFDARYRGNRAEFNRLREEMRGKKKGAAGNGGGASAEGNE